MKYEYTTGRYVFATVDRWLNGMANEGWELIHANVLRDKEFDVILFCVWRREAK